LSGAPVFGSIIAQTDPRQTPPRGSPREDIAMMRNAGIAVALTASLTFGAPVAAQSAADFYKGKTVSIAVPADAGGSSSHYALLFGDVFAKHIPGNPHVIVQHMPGAGGLRAANFVYNVAPKDGTTLLMSLDTMVVSELTQPEGAKYKSDKFNWIGTIVQTNAVLAVRSDTGVKSVADLKAKPVIMASAGKGSQMSMVPAMLNGILGTRMKIVAGYSGSAKALLSVEQGETQGACITWGSWKLQRSDWFKSGFVVPIVQLGLYKEPDLPDVPMAHDLVTDAGDKRIIELLSSLSPIGRGLAGPPDMPTDRVAALRAAFDRAVKDPALLAEARKRNLDINPLSGTELQRFISGVAAMPPDLLKRAQQAIAGSD
jgi:tripartite-type tricarboxylate transporter receptor subunit TctC